ncbi:YfdX family protein [Nitratifractor sp.]
MKKLLLSSIVAAALIGGLNAAEAKAGNDAKSVKTQAIAHAKAKAQSDKQALKVAEEAVEAVQLTHAVLLDLDAGKKDDAMKKLKKAIGDVEVLLSHPNAPLMIPIDASVQVKSFAGSAYDVENAVISSIALLENGRVQDARLIVQNLVDEVDFITINLPLASYPAALKQAAKYLQENKVDAAKAVLATALGTFVEIDVVTPIGILQAQELIAAAEKAAKAKKKKLALAYLDAAKAALKKSQALGYTSTSDTTYKMLQEAINKVEDEVKGENKAEKLFKELIAKLKEFEEKAVKSIKK